MAHSLPPFLRHSFNNCLLFSSLFCPNTPSLFWVLLFGHSFPVILQLPAFDLFAIPIHALPQLCLQPLFRQHLQSLFQLSLWLGFNRFTNRAFGHHRPPATLTPLPIRFLDSHSLKYPPSLISGRLSVNLLHFDRPSFNTRSLILWPSSANYWPIMLTFMDLCFTMRTLSYCTLAYRHLLLVLYSLL